MEKRGIEFLLDQYNRVICSRPIESDRMRRRHNYTIGTIISIAVFSSSSISQPPISSLTSDTPNLVNIVAAATLSSKKLHRYSTLDIILEKKCLIWPNRYKFYNLGIATRALNSAHMPKIGCAPKA